MAEYFGYAPNSSRISKYKLDIGVQQRSDNVGISRTPAGQKLLRCRSCICVNTLLARASEAGCKSAQETYTSHNMEIHTTLPHPIQLVMGLNSNAGGRYK